MSYHGWLVSYHLYTIYCSCRYFCLIDCSLGRRCLRAFRPPSPPLFTTLQSSSPASNDRNSPKFMFHSIAILTLLLLQMDHTVFTSPIFPYPSRSFLLPRRNKNKNKDSLIYRIDCCYFLYNQFHLAPIIIHTTQVILWIPYFFFYCYP